MTKKKVGLVIKKTYGLNKMICNNPRHFVRKDTVFSPHDLAFLLIKSKKNKYKVKLSTNLIIKKNRQR